MHIKSRIAQTSQLQSQNDVSEYQYNKSKAIKFKVDFYSDNSTILKNIKLNSGKNQCSYFKWKPSNNLITSFDQSNIRPIRQLVLIENYDSSIQNLPYFCSLQIRMLQVYKYGS